MYLHLANAQLTLDDATRMEALLRNAGEDFNLELMDGFFTALLIGPKAMDLQAMQKLIGDALQKGQTNAEDRSQLETDLAKLWLTRSACLLGDVSHEDSIWQPLLRVQSAHDAPEKFAKDWAEGFLLATNIHAEHWRAAAEQNEAIDDCATLLSGLVSNEGDDGALSETIRQKLIDSLPIAVQTLEQYWRPWRAQVTIVKEQKIGRNDPCPCGSGKKYKKCCGGEVAH